MAQRGLPLTLYHVLACVPDGMCGGVVMRKLQKGPFQAIESGELCVCGNGSNDTRGYIGAQRRNVAIGLLAIEQHEDLILLYKVVLSSHVPDGLNSAAGTGRAIAYGNEVIK